MTFFPKVINSMYKKSVLQDFILQAKFKLNFLICSFLQNVHSKGCYYYFHSRDIIFVADLIQPRKLSWSCAWSIKPYLSVEWFTFWIGDSLWTTLFTNKYSNKLVDKTAIWIQWANVYSEFYAQTVQYTYTSIYWYRASWTIPQHAIVKVVLGVIRRLNVTISGSESTTASGAITGHCVTRDTWPRYPATSTRHSPLSLLQQTCLKCQLTVCCVCIFLF